VLQFRLTPTTVTRSRIRRELPEELVGQHGSEHRFNDFHATLFYTFDNQQSRERTRQIIDTTRSGTPDNDWITKLAATRRSASACGTKACWKAPDINVDNQAPHPHFNVGGQRHRPRPESAGVAGSVGAIGEPQPDGAISLDRQTTLRAAYSYRHFNSADWALQQALASMAGMIKATNVCLYRTAWLSRSSAHSASRESARITSGYRAMHGAGRRWRANAGGLGATHRLRAVLPASSARQRFSRRYGPPQR
jgi:hypothetical protein